MPPPATTRAQYVPLLVQFQMMVEEVEEAWLSLPSVMLVLTVILESSLMVIGLESSGGGVCVFVGWNRDLQPRPQPRNYKPAT